MPEKSYVTSLPDKTGAFMLASKIIARHGGNIVRASYNKAVDLHTLFIDVEATEEGLVKITRELEQVGYLNENIPEVRVVVAMVRMPDVAGAALPVLKILDRYDISISYINTNTDDSGYQSFKMGLLIEKPDLIKLVLDEVGEIYPIDILDYDDHGTNLDNAIFYIRLANDMKKLLGLSREQTVEFLSESNRIFQSLQDTGEKPDKVFDYIKRFATFVSRYRGEGYKADIEKFPISDRITLYNIQPPCGSNTYVLESPSELLLVDTGYTLYGDELTHVLETLFPGFSERAGRIYVTHADMDHCGLLERFRQMPVFVNRKSAENLKRQRLGLPDFREDRPLGMGYSKLSRIITGYVPASEERLSYIDDESTPENHEELILLGSFSMEDMEFEVMEGSGGHLDGEMIFVCRRFGVVFTGDNLVNISGFSAERAEFNALAPYLLRSVNKDSRKATHMRHRIIEMVEKIEAENKKPCLICGGHGPVSVLSSGKLKRPSQLNLTSEQPL